jgi:SAM-dependent methyltransferase
MSSMSEPNQQQRELWDGEGGVRWVADADRRDEVLEPVGEVLLAAAQLHQGEAVLDVGCGCGATTLLAADAVAPARVLGVDLSGPMLEVARSRAEGRNVELRKLDAQTDPIGAGFAVAISRFGTMFFDDQVAAFTNIRRALSPGARLCLATWQPLAANDWLAVPGAALLPYGPLPDSADGPGMFAQSDPPVIESVLTSAGWSGVEVEPVSLSLRLGWDAAQAADYVTGTGIIRAVLDLLDPERRAEAVDDVRVALGEHQRDDGVWVGAGIHLVRATA